MIRTSNQSAPKHLKQAICRRHGSVAKSAIVAGTLALALTPLTAFAATTSQASEQQFDQKERPQMAQVFDRQAPADNEEPPALPNGEQPVEGEEPPALPDGEKPVEGEEPPALPARASSLPRCRTASSPSRARSPRRCPTAPSMPSALPSRSRHNLTYQRDFFR